jgi:hypothetical protein
MIKSFASGGDKQQARKNYKDEMSFKLQCMMFIFCNELPDVEPAVAKDTMDAFIFKSKFVSKADMDELGEDRPAFFKLKDENIKEWCNNEYVLDAFTSIIFDHYESVRPSMSKDMRDDTNITKGDESKSLEVAFCKIFQYSPIETDKLSMTEIVEILNTRGVQCMTSRKIVSTLMAMQIGKHAQYSFSGVKQYGFAFIKEKPVAVNVE